MYDSLQDFKLPLEIPEMIVEQLDFMTGLWYAVQCARKNEVADSTVNFERYMATLCLDDGNNLIEWSASKALLEGISYPGEDPTVRFSNCEGDRFHIYPSNVFSDLTIVEDTYLEFKTALKTDHLSNFRFDICHWYATRLMNTHVRMEQDACHHNREPDWTYFGCIFDNVFTTPLVALAIRSVELFAQQIGVDTYPAVQRNSTCVHNVVHEIQKPLVVVVNINGHPTCALVDSGSLDDFISSTLFEQLGLKRAELHVPVAACCAGVKVLYQFYNVCGSEISKGQ